MVEWPRASPATPASPIPDRVTSRHIEIGLTDEADAMRYVLRRLVAERDRDPRVLLVGHEFGSVTTAAATCLAWCPSCARATFVSVGDGRDHVPPRVLHVGGGPRAWSPSSSSRSSGAGARPASRSPSRPRSGLALRGKRLRPLPRARGRDLADGGQRGHRHARRIRGRLRRVDAGDARRRRLRRRHRRAPLPPAGAGAGLARPALLGRDGISLANGELLEHTACST